MAETPSQQQQTTAASQPSTGSDPDSLQYWCYQCEKRVTVETVADLPDVKCVDCKSGFVESIAAVASGPSPSPSAPSSRGGDPPDEHYMGNQVLQVLRLITQAARESDAPPTIPDPDYEEYHRIELNGWDNDDDANSVEVRNEEDEEEPGERYDRDGRNQERSDEGSEDNGSRDERNDEDLRRRRGDVLRLLLRDFAARSANRRHRISDWADILMGLEDHSIEFRLQVDDYVGNPGDYVDADGYEALLQNLAEADSGGRKGAPPAAKSAVSSLETLDIKTEEDVVVCAICKDSVTVGESAKRLPCGHGYHGECIIPWLDSRNSCPVCRFELPSDDPEYEEDRKKRETVVHGGASSSSGGYDPGFD